MLFMPFIATFPQHSEGHHLGFTSSFGAAFGPSSLFPWPTSHLLASADQKAAGLPLPLQ